MTLTATRTPVAPGWLRFSHRPPIDGLRAIAALLVVLFHAQLPGLGNGYVGVDVFFVLSGYLITSLLLRERLGEGRIRLRAFYARRMRRLLPAALTVLLVTAVLYSLAAPAFDVIQNRAGFAFAALYVSNWYFLAQSNDYFAQDASPSPVLHYWSLSVEEQFYLLWPLLLLGLLAIPAVRRRLAPLVLGALTLGMLGLSALVAHQHLMLAYFGTMGRAYQLLLGATLATVVLWRDRRRAEVGPSPFDGALHLLGRFLVPVGVVVLLLAGTGLGPDDPWTTGLVGCLATVAVLAGIELVPTGRVQGVLSAKVPQLLGRWSYSIYLWHWPVIVLALTVGILPSAWWLRVPLVVLVTVALSQLTWVAIEGRAMRITLRGLPRQRAVVVGGVALTLVAAFASQRILHVAPAAQALYTQVTQSDDDASTSSSSGAPSSVTVSNVVPGGRTVMLIGDSHAGLWKAGLTAYGAAHGFGLVTVATRGCPWMEVNPDWGTTEDPDCAGTLHDAALAAIKKYHPEVVLLASRSIDVRNLRTPSGDLAPDAPGWAALVRAGARSYLDRLAPYTQHLVLLEPLPETAKSMAACLADPHKAGACDLPVKPMPGQAAVEQIFRQLDASSPEITSVSLDELICPAGRCPAEVGGVPTHRDTNHLTEQYAAQLAPAVVAKLASAGVDL